MPPRASSIYVKPFTKVHFEIGWLLMRKTGRHWCDQWRPSAANL